MPLAQLTLVDTGAQLESSLAGLSDLAAVGVDVERSDAHRYYRAAALIQVGGEGRVVLVDPLALDDLVALQAFLAERRSILHACENDLEPLASLGVVPPQVEDTAVAAAVLGLPTGLEGLLADLLDVELDGDKAAMQRADWEARPLTEKMMAYAAGDVADLPALWWALEGRLREAGRLGWYREELDAVRALPPVEERRAWTRTKGAGRLNRAARARLRALWETRERLGRDTNTAPGRIVGDRVLVDLAVSPPTAVSELGRRGVRRQAVRRFGGDLVAAVANGAAAPETDGRARGNGRAPTEADRALADRLRTLRAERARELAIDPGVLCPGRTLMSALLTDPATPDDLRAALGLRDWQWQQLGAVFCEALGLPAPDAGPATIEGEPDDG